MPSITIRSAEKIVVQESGEWILSVAFDIVDEQNNVLATKRHGFPLNTTPDQLREELAAVLTAWEKDQLTAAIHAEFAAQDAQADETIAAIVGSSITV